MYGTYKLSCYLAKTVSGFGRAATLAVVVGSGIPLGGCNAQLRDGMSTKATSTPPLTPDQRTAFQNQCARLKATMNGILADPNPDLSDFDKTEHLSVLSKAHGLELSYRVGPNTPVASWGQERFDAITQGAIHTIQDVHYDWKTYRYLGLSGLFTLISTVAWVLLSRMGQPVASQMIPATMREDENGMRFGWMPIPIGVGIFATLISIATLQSAHQGVYPFRSDDVCEISD